MFEEQVSKTHVQLDMDAYVIVENERELRRFARSVAIARAHEYDGGDLEDELKAIDSSPAGAIMVALDLLAYIDSIPGVTADGSSVHAYDPYATEQQDKTKPRVELTSS